MEPSFLKGLEEAWKDDLNVGIVTEYQKALAPPPPDDRRHRPLDDDYSEMAKCLLKSELKRRNLTYAQLAKAVTALAGNTTESTIRNRISRGHFSASFFILCLTAIGCEKLQLR